MSPHPFRILLILVLACFASLPCRAADPAIIELDPPSSTTPWLGQRLDLVFNVAVEGQFKGATYLDLPEIPGAILFRASERPTLSSREIDGKSYSVQRHEISLFCQRPGPLTVTGIVVRCGSVPAFGQAATEHRLEAPELSITPRSQPELGAGEIAITSSLFEVTETWDPQPGEAKPGDAFERRITISAENLPAMLLPALPPISFDGLASYPAAPQLDDQSNRGDFKATRINQTTYLCEAGGTYPLPSLGFRCWNPDSETWIVRQLPAVTITVAAAASVAESSTERPVHWGWLTGIPLLLLAGIAFAIKLRRRDESPEGLAFTAFLEACDRDTPGPAVTEFHRWLALSTQTQPDPGTRSALRRAEEAIISPKQRWDGTELRTSARALRRSRKAKLSATASDLPQLNPSSSPPKPPGDEL